MLNEDLRKKLIHYTAIIMFVLSGIITIGLLWLLSKMGGSSGIDYMDGIIKNVLSVAFLLLLCLDGITFSLALILNKIDVSENQDNVTLRSNTTKKVKNQTDENDDQRLII